MLADGRVATRLPAKDLQRARAFYSEMLGLEPVDERPGGLLYRCSGADFALYESTGASPGTFTQMAFEVDDIEATVAELKRRGVEFYSDSIVEVEGNYPSKNSHGERANWFWDSERNLIGVGQALR